MVFSEFVDVAFPAALDLILLPEDIGVGARFLDVAGIRLDYTYPVKIALILIPTMMAVALSAALGPAESAVRSSLVEALEYE